MMLFWTLWKIGCRNYPTGLGCSERELRFGKEKPGLPKERLRLPKETLGFTKEVIGFLKQTL